MKKSFKVFALSLVAVSTLFACSKEIDVLNDKPVVEGNKTILTIKATNPESVATKTTMSGTTPSWLAGDQITVIYKNTSDAVATAESTQLAEANTTATFNATLVDAKTSINGYAVYPANDRAQTLSVAMIPIAAEQHPTGTAFDGASDIMVSEAFTPAGTVSTRFARLGAILRVKVSNATLNDEKILSLSVTAESNLVGNASVNLSDASLSGLSNGNTTVTATYEPANQFTVGAAEKYVYLIVYPQELSAGSTLTISGETENTTFSRDITLLNKIVLNPGHIVPLNVTISSFTVKEKVFFEERFSEGAGTTGFTGSVAAATFVADNDGWEADNKYCGDECARFGKSKNAGIATTPSIVIPKVYWDQDIKVSFKAGAWKSAGTELGLSADDATITSSVDIASEDWSEHVVSLSSVTKSPITITFTPAERFLLDDVCVYYGTKPKVKEPAGLAYTVDDIKKVVGDDNFTNALTNPHDLTVNYSSNNTTVAEVNSSTGEVTIKAVGTAYITASSEATADYTAGEATYKLTVSATAEDPITETIDFESAESTYTSFWNFSSFKNTDTAITAHGGSKYCTTGGTTTWSVKTKNKIPTPKSITFYVSKTSNNTTTSNWKVQYSSNGSDWTDAKSVSATSMSKGNWNEVTHTFTTQSNVYVRIYYDGSTAVRTIDDISFTYVE